MINRQLARLRYHPHLRDRVLAIYDRFLRRSFGKFLPGRGRVAGICVSGVDSLLFVRLGTTDWLVLEEIFGKGEYAPLAQMGLHEVRRIVDLGGNIGLSVRLWQRMFPGAVVLVVEPDPANVEMIRRNCPPDSQVRIVRACVAAVAGKVHLDRSRGEWGIRMTAQSGKLVVDALTLPQILEATDFLGEIDLLKCDIEGAEAELFGNCAPWIDRVRAMVVEIHQPYTLAQFQNDLAKGGARFDLAATNKSGEQTTAFLRRAAVL
jgi:FkbM family methyltransferase